ncbi:MAG: (Fe-S)-binding protein [Planctomycetota bacterium]
MRILLLPTCLVDQCWPQVGLGAANLLERLGCEVVVDPAATCCGQPAFNSGHLRSARAQASQWITSFERSRADYVVLPSGSCGAMVHHFDGLFDASDPWHARASSMASVTVELCSFVVRILGVTDVGAEFSGRVGWHDACHGLRDLGIRSEPRQLLAAVRGAQYVEIPEADSCCGFGGTFAVKYPEISVAIADRKLDAIRAAEIDLLVSGDASCLMHIEGRMRRVGLNVRVMHIAELLGVSA